MNRKEEFSQILSQFVQSYRYDQDTFNSSDEIEFLDQANQWIKDVVEDIEDWSEEGRESSQVDDVSSIGQILCCEPDEENYCQGFPRSQEVSARESTNSLVVKVLENTSDRCELKMP